MKKETKVSAVLRFLHNYIIFFMLCAFIITSCMMLFVSILSASIGIEFTDEHLNAAAKLTFGNVVLLSFVFTLIDILRRRWTVSRPIKKIMDASNQMIEGDFNVRITHTNGLLGEGEFAPIVDSFNKMAKELSGIETLRMDFIANVSHEIKTPLAVLQNYGQMLREPGLSEETRQEYAKAIEETSKRLAHLVTNILKLNKLENQQIFPSFSSYNLGEQLRQSILLFENEWEKKDIHMEIEIAENIDVFADEELLSLVWNNLLSNAFKFTEDGGTVAVRLMADEKYAIVKVRDTGCGMSPEVGAHIFEKFYQGDTSHATQGNGLGLALVKRVIDIMQGEICVESIAKEGSTFTVKIKLNE